ncbi:histone chaperone Rttp106-like-domain-containing protein [Mycena albidolilacea]|uniref:Histone chaperone Rttp106-like-domain-containing protein n=1 Tax=Mycena albidolilacea TaxID=1033008 RepID=A0AAD6ZJ19_9AGAR|nr:histone chaperone Rttp106-like-domain-containing protein [Mycena albidolilacea]
MSAVTPFLNAITSSLPKELSDSLAAFQTPAGTEALDTLIRFVTGGDSPDPETQQKWAETQREAMTALGALTKPPATNGKRQREQDTDSGSEAKRQKTESVESSQDHPPLFTLHAISTTSPIRKKVDINVTSDSISFLNASTRAVESSIPLSAFSRAFLLPTRGKMKPHWTVVILSSDTPDRGKKPAGQSASPQIIFGLDAAASSAVKYTTYAGSTPELNTLKAGTPTRALLLDFIARLGLPVLEPIPAVFKSACAGLAASASEGGVPGIEAYRAAKAGTLWFLRDGVLWGESKPCEFWALEDLLSKTDGLRVVSATGRTCTVMLTRKSPPEELAEAGLDEGEADPGVEVAFSLIDGREQEGINKWVREHRELFGKPKQPGGSAMQVQDDSDEEDGDFEVDSESDGGSAGTSESDDDSDDGGDGSGSEEAEDSDGDNMDEDGDEELKAEHHPLMRPGAMPRMSRAAIDMVAAMVEDELVGDGEDDGEDELED